eukprot:3941740-Rhodomonas_salina.3
MLLREIRKRSCAADDAPSRARQHNSGQTHPDGGGAASGVAETSKGYACESLRMQVWRARAWSVRALARWRAETNARGSLRTKREGGGVRMRGVACLVCWRRRREGEEEEGAHQGAGGCHPQWCSRGARPSSFSSRSRMCAAQHTPRHAAQSRAEHKVRAHAARAGSYLRSQHVPDTAPLCIGAGGAQHRLEVD